MTKTAREILIKLVDDPKTYAVDKCEKAFDKALEELSELVERLKRKMIKFNANEADHEGERIENDLNAEYNQALSNVQGLFKK